MTTITQTPGPKCDPQCHGCHGTYNGPSLRCPYCHGERDDRTVGHALAAGDKRLHMERAADVLRAAGLTVRIGPSGVPFAIYVYTAEEWPHSAFARRESPPQDDLILTPKKKTSRREAPRNAIDEEPVAIAEAKRTHHRYIDGAACAVGDTVRCDSSGMLAVIEDLGPPPGTAVRARWLDNNKQHIFSTTQRLALVRDPAALAQTLRIYDKLVCKSGASGLVVAIDRNPLNFGYVLRHGNTEARFSLPDVIDRFRHGAMILRDKTPR